MSPSIRKAYVKNNFEGVFKFTSENFNEHRGFTETKVLKKSVLSDYATSFAV